MRLCNYTLSPTRINNAKPKALGCCGRQPVRFRDLVVSDSFLTVAGGFAFSKFYSTALTHGSYRLVASRTGVRDSVLDVTLNYAGVVPEPRSIGMMLAGLCLIDFMAARRRA